MAEFILSALRLCSVVICDNSKYGSAELEVEDDHVYLQKKTPKQYMFPEN